MSRLALLLAFAAAVSVRAETNPVPYVLSHHGRLLGPDDHPAEGEKDVTFELHTTDNPQLDQPRWTETVRVKFSDGLYGVLLGNTRQGGKALDLTLLAEPELFVSMRIDGAELHPRLRLPSVPYALRASRAAQAELVLKDGVQTESLRDGAVTLAKLDAALKNQAGKLDADTLDGFDSSAFAPAEIRGNVEAIEASVGTGLSAKVDGLTTAVGAPATSLAAELAGARTSLSAVTGDTAVLKADTATLKADAATLKADTAALKGTLGTLAADQTLAKMMLAQQRYSKTCDPAVDTFLKDAYPGFNDAQITDACLRDGRWHHWGSMYDVVKGKPLPTSFQFAVTNYSGQLQPVYVNSWNVGFRACYGPTMVGDSLHPDGVSLVTQCLSVTPVSREAGVRRTFTLTHRVEDSTAYNFIQRTYEADGTEVGTCTVSGSGHSSCGNSEAQPSFWQLWIRQ